MSKYLNTVTRLPNEAPTVEGRLADIMEKAEVLVDEYHLSDTDRAKVVGALRGVAEDKLASYLTQENSVLHERVRKLEIALAKEREACAKVAEEYGIARDNHEKTPNTLKETALGTAKHIATLIRGRSEQ